MTAGDALAAAVRAEHEVIYGYGVAGAHLTGPDRRRAERALTAHQLRRDQLVGLLAQAGVSAPVASPAYALPFAVTTPSSARQLCARLEDGCAGAAWDLTAATAASSAARTLGVRWLTEAALAAAAWRGLVAPQPALPGRP
jgi:hypothetical protein